MSRSLDFILSIMDVFSKSEVVEFKLEKDGFGALKQEQSWGLEIMH